jgi:hypothetical protein
MKARMAACLLLTVFAAASVGNGKPKPQPKPKTPPRYHCQCANICARVAPAERCQVDRCNGNATR